VILKYSFKTRTGYIPNKPSKTNQDAFFIVKNFGQVKNNWFFGVCDGHGINGHHASDHVKKFLPTNIEFIDYMAVKNKKSPQLKSAKSNNLMKNK
jgi:serine/threonine protein phosphatase PrpC